MSLSPTSLSFPKILFYEFSQCTPLGRLCECSFIPFQHMTLLYYVDKLELEMHTNLLGCVA